MECAAVLFDLDGVLIDSTACVERHWRRWAGVHGLDADLILQDAHGVRNADTMRKFAPRLDVEREAALFAANEVADTEGVVAVNGAASLLAGLEGSAWAIVTSCSAALARARLQAAGLTEPSILITGNDVRQGKPQPEPYLLAAARLGIPPAECVVVEDAPAGVQAGTQAGMYVIAIAFTYPRARLVSSGANVVIDGIQSMTTRASPDGKVLIRLAGT
jgi:sugar-phosphatase